MVSKLETTAYSALLFPSKTKLPPSVYQISSGLIRGSSDNPSPGWFCPVVQGFLTGGLLGSETGPHDLSAEFVFRCPGFQHDGPSPAMDFLHVPPLPWELH